MSILILQNIWWALIMIGIMIALALLIEGERDQSCPRAQGGSTMERVRQG